MRMGDTMLGLLAAQSTLPACEGTVAAILLNIAMTGRLSVFENSCIKLGWFPVDCVDIGVV